MDNSFSVRDKVVIVTGATGVLGQAFVSALGLEGAIVGVLGRNKDVATQRVKDIISHGGKAIALIADVLDEEQLVAAKDLVMAEYGKIDGLVNAAGGNMPGAVVAPEQDIFNLDFS